MKFKFQITCIITFVFVTFISCEQNRQPYKNISKIYVVNNPENTCFRIKNNSNTISHFSFKLNGNFFESTNDIKNEVYNLAANKNDSLFYYAWKFICKNCYSNASLTKGNWSTSLILYINSIGFGLCGKEAIVLSNLWKLFGYNTRIRGLNGHIVPEVFVNNKWQMLDPAYRVFFLNEKNEIASVDELSKNSKLITNPKKIEKNDLFYKLRYSDNYAKLYTSTKNIKIIYNDEISDDFNNFYIELPPNASVEFPGIFIKNTKTINSLEIPYYSNLKIKIPPNWNGKIKNNLILAGIVGKGKFTINREKYYVSNSITINYISGIKEFIDEIDILEHKDTLELIYFLNPNLSEVVTTNTISIKGTNIDSLYINHFNIPDSISVLKKLAKQYFFYENKRIETLKKSKIIDSLNYISIKNKKELETEFRNYLTLKKHSNKEITFYIDKLNNILDSLPLNYNYVFFYTIINNIPSELIFEDIINASESNFRETLINIANK